MKWKFDWPLALVLIALPMLLTTFLVWASESYTPSATQLGATVTLPEDHITLRNARSVNTPLKALADGITYLGAHTLAPGSIVLDPRYAVSISTGYELVNRRGRIFAQLTDSKTFTTSRTVAAATPEYGWTWLNRTNLTSADENTTTAGVMTGIIGAGSYVRGSTSPFRYRLYDSPHGGQPLEFIAGFSCPTGCGASQETVGWNIERASNVSRYFEASVGYHSSGGGPSIVTGNSTSFQVTGITSGQMTTGIMFRMVIEDPCIRTYWYLTSPTTPPSPSGWVDTQSFTECALLASTAGGRLKVGYYWRSDGAGNGFTAKVHHYNGSDSMGWAPSNGAGPNTDIGQWGAQQYSTSGPTLDFGTFDLASSGAVLPQTRIRAALQNCIDALPGDAAITTIRLTGGSASPVTGSGAFAAPGSVVVPTGVRYVRIEAKITSSGDTHGSFQPCVLEVSPS